jgi:hypothetical protein
MKSVSLKIAGSRSTIYVLAAIIGLLLYSLSLLGQGSFGRILGTITDQSGAVIAGATVSIIDTQRGLARTLTTDQAGEYNAPTLIPGTYTIRVEAKGFQTLNRENVLLELGKEVRVDLTPMPGQQTQSVTISEAAPIVDTASATLGGAIANQEINDLPLNGRNYQNLLSLRPGVLFQKGGSPWTQSTNNGRPDETSWMVDGILNMHFYSSAPVAGGSGYFTDGTTIVPIDAIQEFNTMENPKAEYGGKPGAIVNVGIRSGTNQFHGAAYAFGRDGAWDARNLFTPAPAPVLPVELEQFGAVIGGPIKKDKLFFFAGYEGLRSSLGNALTTNTPETASQATAANPVGDPQNSMVDAIRALQAAGAPISPLSLTLLGCPSGALTIASTCTGGYIQGAHPNSTAYVSTLPNNNTSDNGIAKVDYNLSQKHRINGMYWKGSYTGTGIDFPEVNSVWNNTNANSGQMITGNWVYTPTSSLVNEFRVGYTRYTTFIAPNDSNIFANGQSYPINTGVTDFGGFPFVKINGFGSHLGGQDGRPTGSGPNPYLEFQDNVSYLFGKHSLKFGAEIAHIDAGLYHHFTRGLISFQGGQAFSGSTQLEDFFAGLPTFGTRVIGNLDVRATWHGLGGFVQDDWRITRKILLNLGMRYSYYSPMHEVHNALGNFDPNSPYGMVQQGQPSVGSTLWKPDYGNWSPRMGFAWDLTGKGTTVIRGGVGIFYTLYSLDYFTDWSAPNSSTGSIAAVPTGGCTTTVSIGTPCPQTFGGTLLRGNVRIPGSALNWNGVVFPSGLTLSCTAAAPCSLGALDPHLKTPFITSWNFGVQHAFTNNLGLDVSYVGNHGDNLLGVIDINQINPATGTQPYAAQFPYLQFINKVVNNAWSNYHSLQTTLTQRLSHGFNFIAAYTYGHGLDNGSLNRFGLPPMNSYNPAAEYSSGDFDIRHRGTFSAGYEIPGRKGFGQLLQGWKLNTILTLSGAQPWTPVDSSYNFAGNAENIGRWDFFGNSSDFKVTSSSLPWCSGFGVTPAGGVDTSGVTCTSTSGISGLVSKYPSSFAAKCASLAPDPNTLATGGCFVSRNGRSVMVPPVNGTFGTMGRNMFRDTGFYNVDFSVFKNFNFKERYNATFRFEVFNLFNHPDLTNPYSYGSGNDPSNPTAFGCGCLTPDFAAGNPIVGSGSARDIQLGFKLTF